MKSNVKACVLLGMLAAVVGAGYSYAGEEAPAGTNAVAEVKQQTVCPVMGGKINKAAYVDHDGKRIYLCCAGCGGAIKADPEKYIKKLEDEGITLDKAEDAEKKAEGGEAAKGSEAEKK